MNNIFGEYEEWLQYCINKNGNFLIEEKLVEERGTNYEEFKKIIDTILISLEYAVKGVENNYKFLLSKNIIIDNAFLYKPTLQIIWENNNTTEAYSSLGKAYYNNIDDKLCDVKIVYYEGNYNFPKYDVMSLKISLWHEIQHIYRQYKVLKKEFENEEINNKEKNYRELYTVRENDDTINRAIKAALYYSDINEINSHLNEMIPYLETHKNINFKNYKNFLSEIPGYSIITYLKEIASIYNDKNMYSNSKFVEKVGNVIYNRLYKNNTYYMNNDNLTPNECIKRLRRRLNSAVLYAQKQFYKILSYTLDKLQREGFYRIKSGNEYYDVFKEYKKILD